MNLTFWTENFLQFLFTFFVLCFYIYSITIGLGFTFKDVQTVCHLKHKGDPTHRAAAGAPIGQTLRVPDQHKTACQSMLLLVLCEWCLIII